MQRMAPYSFHFPPRRKLNWLLFSLSLGFLTALVQLAYHKEDFRINLTFVSTAPFALTLNGKEVALETPAHTILSSTSGVFTGMTKNLKFSLKKDQLMLHFLSLPKEVEILSFRSQGRDPYGLLLFSFYENLSKPLKEKLGLYPDVLDYPLLYKRAGVILEGEIPLELPLDLSLLRQLNMGGQNTLWGNFVLTFFLYWCIHFLLFSLACLPLFFLNPQRRRALKENLQSTLFFLLASILAVLWLIYAFLLLKAAHIWDLSPLVHYPLFLLYFSKGIIHYGFLLFMIFGLSFYLPTLLRPLAILGIFFIYASLIVQSGFLVFTGDWLKKEFLNMFEWELFFSTVGTLPLFFSAFLLITCFWLSLKRHSKSFPFFYLSFLPLFLLVTYPLLFGAGLGLHHAGIPIYNLKSPAGRLTFASPWQPSLDFSRELMRFVRQIFLTEKEDLNLALFPPEDAHSLNELGFHLGKETSHYPAGDRPFRRVILLTLEGYRLHYIPEFNPLIKDLVSPYPFFNRPEVQLAQLPHYYAATAFTTNSLTTIFSSHPNPLALHQRLGGVEHYPGLGKFFRERGFMTIFVRTSSAHFDNYDILFPKLGIDKVLEMKQMQYVSQKDYEDIALLRPKAWQYPSRLLFKEVIGHLKEAGEDPIFMLMINTDTHNPPVGMAMVNPMNYGNLSYPKEGVNLSLSKDIQNTLASTYRMAHDLNLFYEELKREGLWDADTLLIVTADHSQFSIDKTLFPANPAKMLFDPLPLFILSERPLPPLPRDAYASHLDLAPTILDLMGIDKPAGYWGVSLYSPQLANKKAWFNLGDGVMYSQDASGAKSYSLSLYPELEKAYGEFWLAGEDFDPTQRIKH